MSDSKDIQPMLSPRDQVIGWLLDGHRDGDIRDAILAKWPGEDPEKLCLLAVDHFAASASCDLAVVVGWALEAYRDLYRRMIAIGDFAGAMKAVKELTALAVTHGIRATTDEENEGDDIAKKDGEEIPANSS